ncbi:MAG: (Fe-S)-binding protein [Gammaproteobacteria bacterium]|nr:(Fe-S)-binding protein [Gammaproteobacteria bacterium]
MDEVTREIFGNISSSGQTLFYAMSAVSVLIFAARLGLRARRWLGGARGRHAMQWLAWGRWRHFLTHVFAQPRLLRAPSAGVSHLLIFWGFLVLFIGTILVAIEHHTPLSFFHGMFYLLFSLITDVFGILLIAGVCIAGYRRYVLRPPRSRTGGYGVALLLLGTLGGTGFLVEGLRMAYTGSHWFDWSPGGALVAALVKTGNPDPALIGAWHRGAWWFHATVASLFVALLPGGRMLHAIAASLNVFFVDPTRPKGALVTPFRLEDLESGATTATGPATATDLSSRQLLSLDACTECGLCELACPATAAGRPLSPKRVVTRLRDHLEQGGTAPARTPIEAIVSPEEAWSCTTCRACVDACPVSVQHIDFVLDIRRAVVTKSRIEPAMSATLDKLSTTGNPFGLPAAQRMAWTAELPAGVRVDEAREGGEFDLLFWVGCAGAFDARAQRISRAVATVLSRAGVRFAVLGAEERCTGDPARRLGEEGLFQQLARHNVATLGKYGVRTIVTACPHCFNTLKNEYSEFGGDYAVVHHSELIARLLAEERVQLEPQAAQYRLTYHDACYLGRHNDVYDAPRTALAAATGAPLLEMPRSRAQSLCCGAGGANAWFDLGLGTRINAMRYGDAVDTGAQVVATACPFCVTMFEEIADASAPDQRLEVSDIAEIVERASRR